MLNVLKVFLQSVDEGLADIIDELEDACTSDSQASDELKAAIVKFQQLSFQKREALSTEHQNLKQETNKNSFEWFDNFFGDVITLLKNPLSPMFGGHKTHSEKSIPEVVCRLPLAVDHLENSSKNKLKISKDDAESSFEELPNQTTPFCKSEKGFSPEPSNDPSWRRPKSQFDFESNWSNTQAASNGTKSKRPLDLQKSDLSFDDVFTLENFSIDESSRSD